MYLICFLGYDKAEVERLVSEGKLNREKSQSRSHSVSMSSLDREYEDSEIIRQVNGDFLLPSINLVTTF